jgi:hypothetical protein
MQNFHANIFCAALILLISVSAFITPARVNTVTLDWVGPNGNAAGGYHISPYTAQIDGTNESVLLYCIDFNHEVAPPYQWKANIQPLTSNVSSYQYPSSPNATYPNASLEYQAAAWLITNLPWRVRLTPSSGLSTSMPLGRSLSIRRTRARSTIP